MVLQYVFDIVHWSGIEVIILRVGIQRIFPTPSPPIITTFITVQVSQVANRTLQSGLNETPLNTITLSCLDL